MTDAPIVRMARLLAARGMARGGIKYEDVKTGASHRVRTTQPPIAQPTLRLEGTEHTTACAMVVPVAELIRQYDIDEFYKHKKQIVKSLKAEGVKIKLIKKRIIPQHLKKEKRSAQKGTGYVSGGSWAGPHVRSRGSSVALRRTAGCREASEGGPRRRLARRRLRCCRPCGGASRWARGVGLACAVFAHQRSPIAHAAGGAGV